MRLIENGAELSSLKPIDLQLDMKDLDDYISRQLLSADDDSVPLAIDCRGKSRSSDCYFTESRRQ